MTPMLNDTHDPARRSWLASANLPDADFPLQNLPFGVFEHKGTRCGGVAVGDQVLDLAAAVHAGLFAGSVADAAQAAAMPTLNDFMALGGNASGELRASLAYLLDERASSQVRAGVAELLVPADQVRMHVPCAVGDYTDFLTSVHHTERLGRFKGLDKPLPPAFKSLPVAYHGRASSLRVSGTPVQRPHGQWLGPEGKVVYGPVEALDFELELAAYVARGNELTQAIPIDVAQEHIFGYCLLNDWSSKGVQWWEQVLGPFLGKSFMTSLAPWVVTQEALAPFAKPLPPRPEGDPRPLPYLTATQASAGDSFAVRLSSTLRTAAMQKAGEAGERISDTDLDCMYWTFRQMLTHHASNGCNLRPGDLLGSGTLSGERTSSMACMTELASAGKQPIVLRNGEKRAWLQDGDEVELRAVAHKEGYIPIGFGSCIGKVLPAST